MLLHFIPPFILIVLAIPFYALPGADKIAVFEHGGRGYEWYIMIQLTVILVSGVVYTFWSVGAIRKHRRKCREGSLMVDNRKLRWLEFLSYGLGVIWLLVLVFDDRIIFIGVAIYVLAIGLYGINRGSTFSTPGADQLPVSPSSKPQKPRYAKSGLKQADKDAVYVMLTDKMKTEAWYKENNLTLQELASRLDIHPNYLSQVINEKEDKNFYAYVNHWRIQAFIRIATQPQNRQYTYLALAYECGFNSKSTFNKYFKRYTDRTPSEYFRV